MKNVEKVILIGCIRTEINCYFETMGTINFILLGKKMKL